MTSPKNKIASTAPASSWTDWGDYSARYKERYKNEPEILKKKQEWRKQNREYTVWRHMINRCLNPKFKQYKDYGGRGIQVCAAWQGKYGYANFLVDMGKRPSDKHQIDRRDNGGNYCKENCRWITRKIQMRNTRFNVYLKVGDETKTLAEWAEIAGIKYTTLYARIYAYRWSPEKAVSLKAFAV